jgi:hypothetical protein
MNKIEIAQHYKTLLPCEQFYVTGSTALAYHGLIELSSAVDLDIILVNPTEAAKELLSRLQNDAPATTKPSAKAEVNYIFMHDGVKIDIFIQSEKVDGLLSHKGIDFSSIKHIIAAKKRINRLKDWVQLRKFSQIFCKQEEFNNFLNQQ